MKIPTSTQIVAGKEKDPFIEIYPPSELPMLPPHTLLQHCALLENALNAALGLMEVLCLSNKDLKEKNKRMKQRVTRGGDNLVNVTHQLLTDTTTIGRCPVQAQKRLQEVQPLRNRQNWRRKRRHGRNASRRFTNNKKLANLSKM